MAENTDHSPAAPTPPPAAPPTATPTAPPPGWRRLALGRLTDWRPRVRWFLAEFFVVLTGVLVALALNAWWGARQEATRERAYLHGIVAELRTTEADLTATIAATDALFDRAQRLVNSFFLPEPPPMDSLMVWWRFTHEDPQPTMGTLRALIATGDLRLIEDDALRTALVKLGERARYYDERLRKWEAVIVGTYESVMPLTIAMQNVYWAEQGRPPTPDVRGGRLWEITRESLPDSVRRPAFTPSIEALLDDEASYRGAYVFMMATRNHLRNQERLLEDVRATRERIEAALG